MQQSIDPATEKEARLRPDFLIPGVGKSGTSSLYAYLRAHPAIYMTPRKEPGFFNWDGAEFSYRGPVDERLYLAATRTIEDYEALFEARQHEAVAGEATPNYLYNEGAAERAYRRYPDLKLVIILRDPVDRLYSHYLHMKRMGDEPLSLTSALKAEPLRRARGYGPSYHYLSQGFYKAQIERFVSRFGWERTRIFLFEDLSRDPMSVVQSIYAFLGVDDRVIPPIGEVHNAFYEPRSKALNALVMKDGAIKRAAKAAFPDSLRARASSLIRRMNGAPKPELDPAIRAELKALYRPEIVALERYLDRDLSAWYSGD